MRVRLTIFILCLLGVTGFNLHAQGGLRPRGDVNCDWSTDINDLTALIDSVMKGVEYDQLYTYAIDINDDHAIDIQDITMLIDGLQNGDLPPMPTFSGTLPVLYINTSNHLNIVSKEEYLQADWWLDAMGIDGYTSIGSSSNPLGMQIKGHGNYTWIVFPEKPYRIKLDTKQPLMGMKSNKHFCLLPHADDLYAKLKNTMGFELSRRIGLSYTPAQAPVEVVLNGQYIGLYFLTEKIRVEKNRVNIEEQDDGETNPDKVTGGWLIEIDNYFEDNTIKIKERDGGNWYDWLWITPHSPENLSSQQQSYIKQFIEKANAAIYTPNKLNTEWEKYIDIDSLACFYIVAEIIDNLECFYGSCYMHKHKGDSTKLIFGPVWDMGQSFERINLTDATSFHYFIYQDEYFHSHWIKEIAKFPHFQRVVNSHWQEFYASGFNGLDIDQMIDDHVAAIRSAWSCHAVRWRYWDWLNIDYAAAQYKSYIHSKIDWLQSQWGFDPSVGPPGDGTHR